MKQFPEIKPMGERGILVNFPPKINEDLLNKLLGLKKILQNSTLKEGVEVVTAFSSLLIFYPSTIENVYDEILKIQGLIGQANIQNKLEQHLFHVPVCYEDKFALDLGLISSQKSISKQEVIDLHTAPVYTVFFIGFLPGFLYLGGLDERLRIPRKEQPRPRIEKGAVGIGENQTGIYPRSSPGGWQIIGNSPIPLFDKNKRPPCEISPGDKLKFYAIDFTKHEKITEEIKRGNFHLKKEIYVG